MSLRKNIIRAVIVLCFSGSVFTSGGWAEEQLRPDGVELQAARAASGEDALRLYKALIKKSPASALLFQEYGEVLFQQKQYPDALLAFQKASSLGYSSLRLFRRLGKCFYKQKQYVKAEEAYRKGLALKPDSHMASFGLALALYGQDKVAAALSLFEKLAERTDLWGLSAKEFLALCCQDLQQYERSITLLKQLLKDAPDDAGLRWTLAKGLYQAKRYPEAVTLLKQITKKSPEKRNAQWLLAKSFYKTKQYEAALPLLDRFIKEKGVRTEAASYYRASALSGLGRAREARAVFNELGKGTSEWSVFARDMHQRLTGKPYRIFIDYLGGYDTGLVQAGDDSVSIGEKDYFNQVYALFEGRVYRNDLLQIWLSGEHYGLHYPELHDNDYFEDSAKLAFLFPDVGPFSEVGLRYQFKYANLDYQAYVRQHHVTLHATYKFEKTRFTFGSSYSANDYFRDSESLTGPAARLYIDYRRKLPLWDHQVRVRAHADYRWAEAESSRRFSQRLKIKYQATIWKSLSGYVEGAYRRDDYPQSQGVIFGNKRRHRTDHRLTGEVRFEYQLHRHVSINWGYTYESQDSRRIEQEYGRHQFDAGFTLSF